MISKPETIRQWLEIILFMKVFFLISIAKSLKSQTRFREKWLRKYTCEASNKGLLSIMYKELIKLYQEKDKYSSKQWMKDISQFTKEKQMGKKKIGLYFHFLKPTSIKWAFTILCTLLSKFCSRKWNKVVSYKMISTNMQNCQMTYSAVTDRKTLKGQVDNLLTRMSAKSDIFIYQWWEFKLGHNCAGI